MAVLRLFASIRDKAKKDSLVIPVNGTLPLEQFLVAAAKIAGVEPAVFLNPSALYAVNQNACGIDCMVTDSDEIAVLPPLSGGV